MVKLKEPTKNYNSTPSNYMIFIINNLTNSKNKTNN